MEQLFAVYKIEKNQTVEKSQVQVHGRALKLLKLNQAIYLTNDHSKLGKIIDIVSYGHCFDEVEPVMGCSLTIRFEENISIPENFDWLYG